MARPTLISVELIQEVTDKLQKLKKYKTPKYKVKIAEHNDGKPIYWYKIPYRVIWKAITKKGIDIEYESLLSAKRKRPEIANALKYFGQDRPEKFEHIKHDNHPKPGTKAFLEEKLKRMSMKFERCERKMHKSRQTRINANRVIKANKKLIKETTELRVQLESEQQKNKLQEFEIEELKMKNESLSIQLALRL